MQALAASALARSRRVTVITVVDEHAQADHQALLEAGFVASRREAIVEFALDDALEALRDVDMPAGGVVRSAGGADVDRLRLLDDELRGDVPGTAGWRSSPAEFHANTFRDPEFDPDTHLNGVDAATATTSAWSVCG